MVKTQARRSLGAGSLVVIVSWLCCPLQIEQSLNAAPPPRGRTRAEAAEGKPAAQTRQSVASAEPVPVAIKTIQVISQKSKVDANVFEAPDLNVEASWSEIVRSVLLTAIPNRYEDRMALPVAVSGFTSGRTRRRARMPA